MAGKEYSLSRESLRQCEANIYAKENRQCISTPAFFFMSAGGFEQLRSRPPPVAETGRRGWGRGQQDASGREADAGSRTPGSLS